MTPPAVMTRVAIGDVAHPMRAVVAVMARIGAIHDAPHMRTVIVVRVAVGDAPHVGPVIITVVDRAISVAVRAMAVAVIAAVAEAEADRQTAGLGRLGRGDDRGAEGCQT